MEKHDGHQKLNKPINRATVSETVNHLFAMIPDCAVASYCGLKILAVPTCRDFPILFLDIFMNMPTSQNRSNWAFRYGFLHLATDSTPKSGMINGFISQRGLHIEEKDGMRYVTVDFCR